MSNRTTLFVLVLFAVATLGAILAGPTIATILFLWPFENKTIDVTDDPSYWGGYKPGECYELNVDMFVIYGGLTPTGESQRPDPKGPSIPSTADEYREDPTRWPLITAVIPKDTRLYVTGFEECQSFEYSTLSVQAKFLLAGGANRSFGINILSERDESASRNGHGQAYKPYLKWLRKIDATTPKK